MLLFAVIDPVAICTLVATVIVAAATVFYVYLTHRILRSQTDPCVVAYTHLGSAKSVNVVNIVIENVGKGLARDIRIERHPDASDEKTWDALLNGDVPGEGRNPRLSLRDTAMKTGIPALPPGGKRIVYWGDFGDVAAFFGRERRGIGVVCKCRRADSTEVTPVSCILEVVSLVRSIREG